MDGAYEDGLQKVKQQLSTPSRATMMKSEPGAAFRNRENQPPLNKPGEKPGAFVERKRTEATTRDTSCKAICTIKLGLRQPGAQEDGRPYIPDDWDKTFKPVLGSYIKFLLSRPDQFRVIEGVAPGLYTVENAASNQLALAPNWEALAKAKGEAKGKGKFKGKGKGKWEGKDGGKDGKGASKGKGKDAGKKGWSVMNGKGKGKSVSGGQPFPRPTRTPPTRAAALLAGAAKQEAGGFEDYKVEEERWDEDPDGAGDRFEEQGGEDFDMSTEYGSDGLKQEEGAGEEEPTEFPAEQAAKHGSFIRSLLMGGGQKRPLAGETGDGEAKRAR